MKIGAGLILFRSTAWKPMENVIATMSHGSDQNRGVVSRVPGVLVHPQFSKI